MFEITLLQEWIKLIAAQILQRTLFSYIAIKNIFLFRRSRIVIVILGSDRLIFRSESGCKGKTYF